MQQNQESVLLKTSLATDVQRSGGILTIAGLSTGIRTSRINSIKQIKGRAEVVQVKTVGATAYVPTGSTPYTIAIGDPLRTRNGQQEELKRYTFVTPADVTTLGATDALRREAIHAALIILINNDAPNNVLAATLAGGTGISITDDAGYYPPFSQTGTGRLGASTVLACQNDDDSGFLSTNVATTTAAVYSAGLGANLASSVPVVDALYGGLLSGYFSTSTGNFAPTTKSATPALNGLPAVAGQIYDTFIIESLDLAPAHNQRGQQALVPKVQGVFVDNGTGTATTNLTGFIAFEREMQRAIGDVYSTDPSSIVEFFDNASSFTSTTTGAAAAGTDNVAVAMNTGKSLLYVNPIGTATILAPLATASGLPLTLDATTQEGYELSAPILTQCPKQFVVGKSEASFYVKFNVGANVNATSFKSFSVGFRKKGVFAVDQTAYEAASIATACLGFKLDTGVAPVFHIITGPGSAGVLTSTSTVVTPAASSINELWITVDINGVAKFYVNGVDKTPLLAATYTFTAGLNLIPFVSTRHAAAADAAPFLLQELFIPNINWRA